MDHISFLIVYNHLNAPEEQPVPSMFGLLTSGFGF